MNVSLVIATLHRTTELDRLLRSLALQTVPPHEVILVDQNPDGRLEPLIAHHAPQLRLKVIKTVSKGVNAARNLGAAHADGDILGFPDDDCLYPPDVLARVARLFGSLDAGAVSGIIVDASGTPSVGRWQARSCQITRANVWTTTVESAAFVRADLFRRVGGFDEVLGPGAPSDYGAHEIDDLFLRLLPCTPELYFDRDLFILHPASVSVYDAHSFRRAYRYGAGLGYVLRKHQFSVLLLLRFLLRSLGGAAVQAARLHFSHSVFYLNVARGRWSGWRRSPSPEHKATR